MQALIERLKELYPEAACTLDYIAGYQLLFNTRLAAQCTDARVNIVKETLYTRFPTLEAIADADIEEMEAVVKPCGFYHHKARDLIEGARMLLSEYGGRVPDTMEELLRIPGVGRKTANLVLGELYGQPAVVADTHCIRLSNRLGLCNSQDPVKVEDALRLLLPPEEQLMFCHRLVAHGRAVCRARAPDCGACGLREFCGEPR
ncbi:MAG: endonuclease III [Oscillospiraceae bacterium]|jgi:endonuclease-3|nr:endonuclease III [Oscillospiraceae bacterium]